MLDDRPAERLPLAGVADGDVEGGLGEPDRDGADAEAAGVEGGEGDRQAATALADEPVGRDRDVVQADGGRRRAGQAHLLLGPGGAEPGQVGRQVEAGDAALAVVGRAQERRVEVGVAAVGDPGLLAAGQPAVVARACARGPHRGGVGAGVRLGQAVGAEQLPADHVRQQVAALRLGAELVDRVAGQRVHADAQRDAGPAGRELLDHLQVDLVGLAAAADVLAEGQAEQAGVARASGRPRAGTAPRARTAAACGASSASASSRVSARRSYGLAGGQFAVDRHGSPSSKTVLTNGTAVLFSVQGHADPPEGGAMTTAVPSAATGLTRRQAELLDQLEELFLAEGFARFTLEDLAAPAALLQEHALRAGREQGAARAARHQALLPQGDRRRRGVDGHRGATRRCG